jgi:glutathionylspermidine synthase
MERLVCTPRPDASKRLEEVGFTFHSNGVRPTSETGGTFWDESAYYKFTADEIEVIENTTNQLHDMCLNAVGEVTQDEALLTRFGVRTDWFDSIKMSWENMHPHVYGRFDLSHGTGSNPKMIEYNADTPTLLIESAIAQWYWLKDKFGDGGDQFNSLHERLVSVWQSLLPRIQFDTFYFVGNGESPEELATVVYMQATAKEAGLVTEWIDLKDIGWNGTNFVDLNDQPMLFMFKLHPWENIGIETFGRHIPTAIETTGFIEPMWKMILSNKAILPLLWEMYPNNKNLLEARWDRPADVTGWFAKPMISREGANIDCYLGGEKEQHTRGEYNGDKIWQRASNTEFLGKHVILGSWVIADEAGGMIVREDTHPIITSTSAVVPHIIDGTKPD